LGRKKKTREGRRRLGTGKRVGIIEGQIPMSEGDVEDD